MADLVITAASVLAGSNAVIDRQRNAGETVTAGQAVSLLSTTGEWMKSDSNSATAELRTPGGIALNGAADGQPLAVQKSGDVTLGAVLTAGVAYYLSDTPGGIAPVADVGSGEYSVILGIAKSTSVLAIDIQASGVAL
jgi:hypothetical protein